jgi:nucleotide sugar dehydrogenase
MREDVFVLRVTVVGLGKIGLPLAVQYASKGHDVVGVDINDALVDVVNRGEEPFPGEAELATRLRQVVEDGHLRSTTSYAEAIPQAQAIVVVVPLVVDEVTWQPDFRALDSATHDIAAHLSAGALVSYETTLPVGTTRSRWKPALEEVSGLSEGSGFNLVFSPERVLTGRVFADLRKYPKLLGGMTEASAEAGRRFYESVLDFDTRPDLPRKNGVWDLGSPEAAELAKLAETTYRDVNIALANQFALFAETHGIDIHRVIEASNSQPYSHIHRPGVAVGGHCIPVYPRLYLFNDPDATVVRAAREANAAMPGTIVARLESAVGSLVGTQVAILGAAYRGDVKETAFSGVFALVEALTAAGAIAKVHDPLFTDVELGAMGLSSYRLGTASDIVIVQADHREYRDLGEEHFPGAHVVMDGRAILNPHSFRNTRLLTLGVGPEPSNS